MMRKEIQRSIVALVFALGPTLGPATAMADGTLAFMPDASWAEPMTEQEMSQVRGGFGGYELPITVNIVSDLVEGSINISPSNTTPTDAPQYTQAPDGSYVVQTIAGSLEGFSGIAQFAYVPGDHNFVQNNMFIQINVGDITGVPTSLQDILTAGGL